MVRASWIEMGCCCWCVLVHLVIMQYRQILMYEYSDHMESSGWRPTLCVHRCLIWWYASLTKRMVMHDTECPYWDYVSLNKKKQPHDLTVTNTNEFMEMLKSALIVWWMNENATVFSFTEWTHTVECLIFARASVHEFREALFLRQ